MSKESVEDIRATIELINQTLKAFRDSSVIFANKEIEYKKAKAIAYTQLDSTLKNKELRESAVMEKTEEQYRLSKKWEIAVEIEREQLRALRDILSAQQSINASLDKEITNGRN